MTTVLQAPFPYFGGKSRIAAAVWARLGDVPNYVEPFFGSGAALLARPHAPGIETVNDADGMVSNFWRATQADPDAVAHHADWPVNENDLHARHYWLVMQKESLQARLEGDPDFYDAKIAGWWCWGMCCWIGGGFCAGRGPWRVEDGRLVKGDAGRGVQRQRVHLSDAGMGVQRGGQNVYDWMRALSERLRRARVCCGDWTRVCGPAVTVAHGLTGVFLDPPYADTAGRDSDLYAVDSETVAHAAREWAIANGDNPKMRIALCGYEGEHVMPTTWECVAWKTSGGYAKLGNGAGRENAHRERIWFSPHCLRGTRQATLERDGRDSDPLPDALIEALKEGKNE